MTLPRRLVCGVASAVRPLAFSRCERDAGRLLCRGVSALLGLLAIAGASPGGTRAVGELQHAVARDAVKQGVWGTVQMPLAPEEIAMQRMLEKQVGPAPIGEHEAAGANQFEQAVFCGVCDADSTTSLEGPLPASWTQWGDAFFNRPDAVAGNWLRDQGCFNIIACAGNVNPANRLRLPAAFDYSAHLPAFKVCGYFSNFNAPNDSVGTQPISLFDVPPDPSGNTYTPSNPVACTFLDSNPPAVANNQRDQDVILFRVPAGGIQGFRLFVTGGQEFIASLGVNKNFPNPGDINSCYVNPVNPVLPNSEYGHLAWIDGDRGITNPDSATADGIEGTINSTWAFPRRGTTFLPEGTYLVTIRTKAFGSLVPPSTPTPPTTRYQIRVAGSFVTGSGIGACCVVGSDSCTDAQTLSQCRALGGVWRGDGTTCAAIDAGAVPCNLGACVGTPEGPGRDCPAALDLNRGCAESPTSGFDPIAPGQTICGYSGGNMTGTFDGVDEDWFTYENTTASTESVRFTLDTEHPTAFQFFYALSGSGDPCADAEGFGTLFDQPVRGAAIEVCINAGQRVLLRLSPRNLPILPCGGPSGPAYRLTLTTAACNAAACCTLAGACAEMPGPDCYAAGGISLGEGTTCASSTCCDSTSSCASGLISENALPFSGGRVGTSDVCITEANYSTYVDTYNGGCENTATVFCNATTGQHLCGTLSAYQHVGDSDWYQVTTIGADSYLGFLLTGEADMDLTLYRKPTGVICPATFADMEPQVIERAIYRACDVNATIVGDCLPAGTYYVRVAARFSNIYGLPCVGGASVAGYRLKVFQGVCTGTQVTCTGAAENEANCQFTNSNGGCNTAPTPNFSTLACNGTICGTADMLSGERDTDWYQIIFPVGWMTVNFQSAFYGKVLVIRPGTSGPSGCGDFTVIDGRSFVQPNTPTSFTVPNLAAGTYWVMVAPDFDGTKRVCCASGSNYRLGVVCTPACACFFDLVGNDCTVNTADLVAFLAQFGRTCASLPPATKCADRDGNGVVGTPDLVAFLGQFGKVGNVTPGVCQ